MLINAQQKAVVVKIGKKREFLGWSKDGGRDPLR
jgi:hypothetical protein